MRHVYFDHNATTALDARVLAAMLPYFGDHYGNASSRHGAGRTAREAVEAARSEVAQALNADPQRIIFTAGGTESNNLALKGLAASMAPGRLLVSPIEHASVRVPAHELSWAGWDLRILKVDRQGRIDREDYQAALAEGAQLVSVMVANNETGVIQDTAELVRLAHAAGALFHADAVQAMGKLPLDFAALGVDALTIAGHKIYGPKGVGALILGPGVDPLPVITGGSHERGYRAGTENVPGIVGLGVAARLAVAEQETTLTALAALRDTLEAGVQRLGGVVFGQGAPRVANTLYFAIPGLLSPDLADALDAEGFQVATGSACAAGKTEPSAVLLAMGYDEALANGAIRISLGKGNTAADVEEFLVALARISSSLLGRSVPQTA